MSNKKMSGSHTGSVIATAAVGLAAVAAVVFLVIMVTNGIGGNNSESTGGLITNVPENFHPSAELIDECNNNAHDLVAGNYEILRLFRLEGVPHEDEPYGNEPEDGYYTAKSSMFATYAGLAAYVKSILVEEEAERVLENFDGNGLKVYGTREEHDGALGIYAGFTPDETYDKPWESTRIQFVPMSETECSLRIFLGADEETDLTAVPSEMTLDATMLKGDDGWRLTKLVY